jgi:hypothetical protein
MVLEASLGTPKKCMWASIIPGIRVESLRSMTVASVVSASSLRAPIAAILSPSIRTATSLLAPPLPSNS